MNLKELLLKNRSYRRFYQDEEIDMTDLEDIIAHVRLSPSPANLQPLKFILINNRQTNAQLFQHLKWAGYLKDWDGPEEGERPSAYIIIMGNSQKSAHVHWDYGIALQTILLSAAEKGWGGCTIGSFDKEKVRKLLDVPKEFDLAAVVALGKPKETVVIDDVLGEDADIKYWRDKDQVHHVPKRKLADLILKQI